MDIDFDYDLDEIVLIDQRYMSLRAAVLEYVQRAKTGHPASQLRFPTWFRDRGKKPGLFETRHIEALARLPVFDRIARPLPQRE
jgi:hypothetical protein